jgi:threonine aldolase
MTVPPAPIDLRSDTVTKPTEAMLERMRQAELGDDGREGDPTVRAFEALAAERTGKEAGMFVVSGTMGNLVALLAHGQPGGAVVLESNAHILRSELGGVASIAGLFHRPVPGVRGAMDLDLLDEAIGPGLSPVRLGTSVVCLETTHNDAGGAVLSLEHMAAVHALAGRRGVPVHTDGARLFNAAAKLGVPVKTIAQHTDTLQFCVSKGLSAPVGSVVVGSRAFITRARTFRRMVGGNLRQGGVIAAAGIVALEQMVDRIVDDHRAARALADGLNRISPRLVEHPERVETNIVQVDIGWSGRGAPEWIAALDQHGVHTAAWSKTLLRLVTHRHIDGAAVERALAAFTAVTQAFADARPRRVAE